MTYTVTFKTTATNKSGLPLDQDQDGTGGEVGQDELTWQFTTVATDAPPTIIAYKPGDTSGQIYNQGDILDVTWFADDDNPLPPNPINITYGSGATWNPVANDEANDYYYSWDTSSLPCPDIYWMNISVYDSIGQTTFSESNYSFDIICLDNLPPMIDNVRLDNVPSLTVPLGTSSVELTAQIDDSGTGASNIGGANYTVGVQNWGTSVDMVPTDGAWDEITENAGKTIDISTWGVGGYQICVYGWDSAVPQNNNITGSCAQMTINPPADQPPILEVWAPGGAAGEQYTQGDIVDIRWNASDDNPPLPMNPINISYGQGAAWSPIVNDVIDSGLYQWDTTSVPCPGIYRVNVSVYDSIGQTVFAESNETFSIFCPGDSPPVITVFEPGGTMGQVHVKGDTIQVTWFADDNNALPPTPINITYADSGSSWILISNDESNDGTYAWVTSTVPCPGTYWVNVSVYDSIGQTTFGEGNYTFEMICPVGDIIGIVIDENGDPIESASVTMRNSTGAMVVATATDVTGGFVFTGIEQGIDEYNITVAKAYYFESVLKDIDVIAAQATDVGTILLQTNAIISGKVIDSSGSQITGATVVMLDDGPNTVGTTTTNALGDFSLTGIGYGDYNVRANATGYLTATRILTIDKDHLDIELNLVLTGIGDITGAVVDEKGDPVGGATVVLTNSTGFIICTAETDSNGAFMFQNVTEGAFEYSIIIEMENYKNAMIDSINVGVGQLENLGTIALVTYATISGKVVRENGTEVVGALVELLDEYGNVISTRYTDISGEYKFIGIGYGKYSLRIGARGFETNTTEHFTVESGNLDITRHDELTAIEPVASSEGIPNWWWVIPVIIIIVVVVIILFLLLLRRRKKRSEPFREYWDTDYY
jgi:hypothetical protein